VNEQSVPPAGPTEENRLIYVYPPLVCSHCTRLTSVALLNSALPHWFAPRCPLHGYAAPYGLHATPQEQADARASIERFVTWMHGDTRRCPGLLTTTIMSQFSTQEKGKQPIDPTATDVSLDD